MRPRLPSLASLVRDERGTSLIEFGFLAPFLALLSMGVIDLSRGLAERFALQQAVNRSLELVQARPQTATGSTTQVDYTFVKVEAKAASGVTDDDDVIVKKWLECDGEEKDYNGTCEEDEDVARYLSVHIAKDFEGEFYFGTIPMSAFGAVRIQ